MRHQKGFTTFELLMAMAVGGLVFPLVISIIYQMFQGTDRIRTESVLQQDIDIASSFFSRDLSQAFTTNLASGDQADQIRVDWIDQSGWAVEGQESHYAEYTLSGDDLWRDYDGTGSAVARRVSDIQFSRSGKLITVTITSSLEATTQTLTYYVTPRADGALK